MILPDSWPKRQARAHYVGEEYLPSRSGILIPESTAKTSRPLLAFDLFCGAGGFSLGIIDAGFTVIGACDNDVNAAITYLYNLGAYPVSIHFVTPEDEARLEKTLKPHYRPERMSGQLTWFRSGMNRPAAYPGVQHFWLGDARKLNGKQMLREMGLGPDDLDLVVGGPPCQGFSRAGKRDIYDPRNSLVFDFARLCVEMQPKTIVMENVPAIAQMVTPEGIPVLDAVARILSDGGMGEYEALRQAFGSKPGTRGYLGRKASRGQTAEAAEPKQKTTSPTQPAQQATLFG